MSAFILEDDTIDLLVTAGTMGSRDNGLRLYFAGEVIAYSKYEDTDLVGTILKTANYESVNYRYQENTEVGTYNYRTVGDIGGALIPWGQVLKSLDCYEYQSCEHPEWETSLAKAICSAIRRKVCRAIADETETEWVWTREKAQEKMTAIREGLKS